ncbi:hypothetical protein [Streptomyces cinerochromogenes]|uniref:hypothetical protein n=1 Tax=Streptomyces cinerochromogenes TaxID=66422 RepID=UPI001670888A|nr:hypothetical protein [Streptomyces cinerochromogenes]
MTARSQQAQALYEQLRALEQRARDALRRTGRRYSRREVARALGRSPYGRTVESRRISDWVPLDRAREPKVPSDRCGDDVLALVRLWSSWAGEEPDERWWRDLLDTAQPVRRPRSATPAPGRPVREFTDPFALQVHRAIDGGAGRELPLYVRRAHDRWLSDVVNSVLRRGDGRWTSAIAVLVGDSSTGKTRACWEALALLPSDWRLLHPLVPDRSEALIAALEDIAPRTVLWLDEVDRFLSGARGEQAAALLREVLDDPRRAPLLVLGTTWPEEWAELVKPRRAGERGDPHAHARALLTGRHHRVPDAFEDTDLPELRRLAARDPRIQEALDHGEQGRITQYLAGGRALLDRYETATALERALIESAMDVRRLGHQVALPRLLLEAAIPHYLTGRRYDMVADDDLEAALTDLGEPSRGTSGPLTPVTVRRPGRPLVVTDTVRLADYLDQHGRRERHTEVPPAGLWDALGDHAAPGSLRALAESAGERGHLRIALRLLVAAAEAKTPGAVLAVSQFLEEHDRHDEALLWCLPLAGTGDPDAMARVAGIMEETRRRDEAVVWHTRAAEAGCRESWMYAGMLLHGAGRHGDAEACFRRALDAGVSRARGPLASLLEHLGRTDEALVHHRQEAEADGGYAVMRAADLMRRRGDSGTAVLVWLLERAREELAREEVRLPWAGTALLHHLAEDTGLRHRLREHSAAGEDGEVRRALTVMVYLGEEFAKAARRTTAQGTAEAPRQDGDPAEALARYEEEAAEGGRGAAAHAAALCERLGRPAQAADWYRRAAEEGDLDALGHTARLMTPAEGPDAAFAWLMACADRRAAAEYGEARATVAQLLHAAGRTREALDWLRRASQAGDPYAWRQYADLLKAAGRTEEAERLRRYGWEPDGAISPPWSAAPPDPLPVRGPAERP